MKIVLVGPVYPYKGGISHYTGLMCKSLREEHEVVMLSFARQYPKLLFRKEQRDYENDAFAVPDTRYLLHTYNPLSWIATARYINRERPDLVIFQWWHPYFAPCYWTICKLLAHTKVMFLCHNVLPHERFPLDITLTKAVLRAGDCYIVHSAADEADLKRICKEALYCRTPHPTYNAFRLRGLSRCEGRRLLGCTEREKLLLFFGFVRKYKGLVHLLRAMPLIAEECAGIKLLIVGDFSDDKEEYIKLIDELGISALTEIHDGYIPDKEVEKFFAAADLVALPYESATQSAVVQVAYGFEKPIVVTDVGGLPEAVQDGKTGYIVPSKDPKALAGAVIRFFAEGRAEEFQENVRREAEKYSWKRMNERVAEVYRRLTEKSNQP